MSSGPSVEELVADAQWLAQAFDPQGRRILFVKLPPEAYRSESFLDDRLFQQQRETAVADWDEIAAALATAARPDANWIFHIGHVGSTLVARLLGELPNVLSVREPRLLRDLMAVSPEHRAAMAPTIRALYARTFDESQAALIKATSFLSELAPGLVSPTGRALFLFASPRNYIASILAGENSMQELASLAGFRAQRMQGRVPGLHEQQRSAAHLAAAAWACEMTSLETAAEAMPGRAIHWADFDRMLEDMAVSLGEVAAFFEIAATADQVSAVVRGPLMTRYSKGLDHEYSPNLRRDLIAGSTQHHRQDIERALAMLSEAAETSPLLARAMSRLEEL
jgi:hypothetical protein